MKIRVEDLSCDQREVYDAIVGWAYGKGAHANVDLLTCGGFAGTGKSTVVSLVAERLDPPVAFCAFTGKASSVLKRKLQVAGIDSVGAQKRKEDSSRSTEQRPYCGTIHSLIYRPCECREPKEVITQKPCSRCGAESTWGPFG